jgi:hypothetical protein
MSGISTKTTLAFGPRKQSRLELMGIRFANDDDPSGGGAGGGDGWKPPESQEELDRIVNTRLGRERDKFKDYDDLKAKAQELDQLRAKQDQPAGGKDDGDKTAAELAELRKQLETVQSSGTETSVKLLRSEIALDKGIGKDDLPLLTATTEEDLNKQADRILALRGEAQKNSQRIPGQGKGGNDASGLDAGKSEYEKRHPKKQ